MVLYWALLNACGHISITEIFFESQQGWHYTDGSPLLVEPEIPVHGLVWTLSEGGTVLEVDHIFQEWTTFYLR